MYLAHAPATKYFFAALSTFVIPPLTILIASIGICPCYNYCINPNPVAGVISRMSFQMASKHFSYSSTT